MSESEGERMVLERFDWRGSLFSLNVIFFRRGLLFGSWVSFLFFYFN